MLSSFFSLDNYHFLICRSSRLDPFSSLLYVLLNTTPKRLSILNFVILQRPSRVHEIFFYRENLLFTPKLLFYRMNKLLNEISKCCSFNHMGFLTFLELANSSVYLCE